MSYIWNFFQKSAGKAFCKAENCQWERDYPPNTTPTLLVQHLKSKHGDLYKKYLALKEAKPKEKTTQMTIKRGFDQSAAGSSSTSSALDPITIDESVPKKQPRIDISLHAISLLCYKYYNKKRTKLGPWEKNGEKTLAINKAIMEMIALDIQPFSLVEDAGFVRLLKLLQPKYTIPSRTHFRMLKNSYSFTTI
jgi:hypothetical protein